MAIKQTRFRFRLAECLSFENVQTALNWALCFSQLHAKFIASTGRIFPPPFPSFVTVFPPLTKKNEQGKPPHLAIFRARKQTKMQ